MAKVLIVDDAAFMRMMIKDILEKNGYNVIGEASNGVKAVEMYKKEKPDIVTMDITMPDMDGIQAVKTIKGFDPSAKIIMCSAMGQQTMVMDAIRAGARDFIVKPFQADRVLEAVKKGSWIEFIMIGGHAMQVVIFKLGDEQFAVETSKVQSINDVMQITRVPKSPDYIKGLINLRGNVISLLDINLLLDVKKSEKKQESMIILEMEDELVGITVDQVDEVLDVEDSMIEKVEDAKKNKYVKGVINFKNRIVTLIDIDNLIAS